MNKKEIIKLLDKEVGLAIISRDENNNGDLYISEAELKTAEQVMLELVGLRNETEKRKDELIKTIKSVGCKKNVLYEELSKSIVKDKIIQIPKRFWLIADGVIFSSSTFMGGEIKVY